MEETKYITKCIKNNIPVTFVKFGDGEHACMTHVVGMNCDFDLYTYKKGNALIKAFKNLISKNNTFIGKWHHANVVDYLITLSEGKNIPWNHYHTLFPPYPLFDNQDNYNLVKAIRESTRNKIIISNELNIKMIPFFKANFFVKIPERNWFDNGYDKAISVIKQAINDTSILIFSAGMGSKVLIDDLSEQFPNCTFLDTGSAFDYIVRGVPSRDQTHSYEKEYEYFKDFL